MATNSNSSQLLPAEPFRSLYVHFGMLLGVDDFQTIDAYHRGKVWLHNTWLHGSGVVWGLDVSLPEKDSDEGPVLNGEVRVEAGCALDNQGRELYLHKAACLDLAKWYAKYQDEPSVIDAAVLDEESGEVTFDGYITLEFHACLARQVPALSENCDSSSATTAYSRVDQTVQVKMHAGRYEYADTYAHAYPRLKLLFGLQPAREDEDGNLIEADAKVLSALSEIDAAPPETKKALALKWFKYFANLDAADIETIDDVHPNGFPKGPPNVLLANLTQITLRKEDDEWRLVDGVVAFNGRETLLPTQLIQSLTASSLTEGAPASVMPAPLPPSDAGGPRIDPATVRMRGTEHLLFNYRGSALMKASVSAQSISVLAFDTRDGWIPCVVKKVKLTEADKEIDVELRDAPGGRLVRLVVKGTGDMPLLGRNRIPLAGGLDSPAGSIHQGNDFVHMFRARRGS